MRFRKSGGLLLFHDPDLGHLTAAAVSSEARFAGPSQAQFTSTGGLKWQIEFERRGRPGPFEKRMDLEIAVRGQAHLSSGRIARIQDAEPVLRFAVEVLILHLQWRVEQRLGPMLPRDRRGVAELIGIIESRQHRCPELRIFDVTWSQYQMRTITRVAEFIVEPIRSRIRASEQFRRGTYLFVRRRQLTHFDDSSSQPRAIGNRVIERCEIRAALHSFSLIPLNSKLHVNTLEQSLAEFAYALTRRPAGGRDCRFGQNSFGLVENHRRIQAVRRFRAWMVSDAQRFSSPADIAQRA